MADFVIGAGKEILEASCMSAMVYCKRDEKDIQSYISHNSRLFWIHSRFLNTSFYIMKDCDEGKLLQKLLDNTESSPEEIIDYLDELALSHLPLKHLKRLIENVKKSAFQQGEQHVKRQLRKLITV